MLHGYKPRRPCVTMSSSDTAVAFGRTTQTPKCLKPFVTPQNLDEDDIGVTKMSVPIRRTMLQNTQFTDDSEPVVATSTVPRHRKPRLSGQESKHIGRQMFASSGTEDLAKAKEKRQRQISYSREIMHARGDKNVSMSLQVDSITRVVVQSFRKLINCERCALFLMDHSRNQLYFKPVGNPATNNQVKMIRFSANSGVAGWCATNKVVLNIKNAYADPRFKSEIDKQTNFRTRTILCAPVLDSNDNRLLGVLQMVNKMKDDGKALQKMAKNKKSDEHNHGYLEVFEPFSEDDEKKLDDCAKQVSTALEEAIALVPESDSERKKTECKKESFCSFATNVEKQPPISPNAIMTPSLRSPPEGGNFASEQRRRSSTRRSSLGSLVQFVSALSKDSEIENDNSTSRDAFIFGNAASVSEALQKFQFRSAPGPQISARRGSLQDDPDRMKAISRRERMEEYTRRGPMKRR